MNFKFWLIFISISVVSFSQTKINDISLQKEVEHSIQNGLNWLEKNQEDDGSWNHYPAITSLVIKAFLESPKNYTEENNVSVERGIQFILSCQKENGGIYVDDLAGYNTAICIIALVATKNPEYADEIQRARDFLISLQWNKDNGYDENNILFGGIGYGEKEKPDLSNLQWAIEALKESENYRKVSESSGKVQEVSKNKIEISKSIASSELFWDNALIFISRCQNNIETNSLSKNNDGGFIYSPSESKAENYTSYGSMTYAGMKSMLYANLQKGDKRIEAAYNWIKNNFTFEENPNMKNQGLYYYYHTMAKSLSAFGEDEIIDSKNISHNWRNEILQKLISLQNGEGYWVNENNRWWENQKVLVTAYSIIAMEFAMLK